ncbi:unnamed protein product [Dicrocoelium dendriticum]|nr:unnamed protein product [Dicrocoelium dendriticum]
MREPLSLYGGRAAEELGGQTAFILWNQRKPRLPQYHCREIERVEGARGGGGGGGGGGGKRQSPNSGGGARAVGGTLCELVMGGRRGGGRGWEGGRGGAGEGSLGWGGGGGEGGAEGWSGGEWGVGGGESVDGKSGGVSGVLSCGCVSGDGVRPTYCSICDVNGVVWLKGGREVHRGGG